MLRWRIKPMPSKFERLAVYNSEIRHGIAHTPEYDAEMRLLQREFDAWTTATDEKRQSW